MSFIKEYKNVIPRDLCESIIETLEEKCVMKPGELLGGVNTKIKKTSDFIITQDIINKNKHWLDVSDNISKIILEYVDKYIFEHIGTEIFRTNDKFKLLNYLGSPFLKGVYVSGPIFQKYNPGDYFKPHSDDNIGHNRRLIAVIIYLNDVKKEDGGSTRFYNGREIQPEVGKIAFFPATWNYLHQGTELKNGVKYIISSFIYSTEYKHFLNLNKSVQNNSQ